MVYGCRTRTGGSCCATALLEGPTSGLVPAKWRTWCAKGSLRLGAPSQTCSTTSRTALRCSPAGLLLLLKPGRAQFWALHV